MKKITWIIIVIAIIIAGYFIWTKINTYKPPTPPPSQNQQTFVSANQNISFKYPALLSVSQKNNIITLHHQIDYVGPDACDFKGDGVISSTLTDFNITMQLFNMSVASTSKVVSPYIPEENFLGDTLKINPGFIDSYNNGQWNGYAIFEGAEGCGQTTYYMPVSSSRTLVIQKIWVGAMSDVSDPTNKQKILATPEVISPDLSDMIFNSIMQTLQVR